MANDEPHPNRAEALAHRDFWQHLGDDVNQLTDTELAACSTLDLAELGRLHDAAREHADLVGRVVKAAVRAKVEQGVLSEAAAARQAGVSRSTVRAALGKS